MHTAMDMPLTKAPFNRMLILKAIAERELEKRLGHLGLFPGHAFSRQEEEVLVHPVRVRSTGGEAILGGGMAMRVIVHLDDGRRMPLTDLIAGQTGHIEGTTCSPRLQETLKVLGLDENEPVTYLRKLPHMDYRVLVGRARRERLNEGAAAKIWGCIGQRFMQFVSAGTGQRFTVKKILGGDRVSRMMEEMGIRPEEILVLESVAPAQTIAMTMLAPVVITTEDGLHLHLRPNQAEHVLVTVLKD